METQPITRKGLMGEILEKINEYRNVEIVSENQVLTTISDISSIIIEGWIDKIISDNKRATVEDYNDLADLLVETIDIAAITVLRNYSLDSSDSPYKISVDKLLNLKKQMSKVLMLTQKNSLTNEFFLSAITISYITPLRKATKNREIVLSKRETITN